jgi:ribonuclease HII
LAFTPTLDFEREAGFPERSVVGVDEVGRGCLAGPVVAAAAVLPESAAHVLPDWIALVQDSKLVRAEVRENLDGLLRGWLRGFHIASANVGEIDTLNIHHASHLAMVRAVEGLGQITSYILVDGKFIPAALRGRGAQALIKGDQRSLSIACASILAKVWRDRHLTELASRFPGYGLEVHKGYPTPAHKRALATLGVTEIHRRSFGPVKSAL